MSAGLLPWIASALLLGGALVGLIVVLLYLPIFQLADSIR